MSDNWRKYVRTYRVNKVRICLKCFELYTEMISRSILAGIENDYDRSESFYNLIGAIFGFDANIGDFIINKNKVGDEALRYYDKLQEMLNMYPEDKDTILAFCKAMYNYPKFTWLKGDGYIYMPMFCDALLDYLLGTITKRQLEDMFVIYKIWEGGKKSPANFCLARKTFRQVEDLYYEIEYKQLKRKEKKNNE